MRTNRYLLLLLAFLPLLIFRDFTPDNELRYLSIADEAIRNGNFFTFTNHGLIYADKPPFYLWIVVLGKLLFGSHNMLFLGLFSVVPALVILYVMDKWVSANVKTENRLSGLLMLLTCGYFIGAGVVLRMDMLMCMFIVLSLYTFYKIYIGQATKWSSVLFPVYVFLALFTKGPIGILVPLLSVIAFLAVKGELKTLGRYWGGKTWIILLIGCGIWFGGVFYEGGYTYLHNLLFNQTVNRAVDSFHHKKPFYYYFETIWYCLAPWSLLYIGVIIAGIKAKLIKTDLEKLFLTVIAVTFVLLSLISSKVEIYMLPAFPFFAYLTVLLLQKMHVGTGIRNLMLLPLAVLGLVFPVVLIANQFVHIDMLNAPVVYLLTALLSVAAIVSLYYLYKKKNLNASANILAVGLLLTIFTGSFFVPSYNKYIGYGEFCKKGKELAQKNGINSYCYYDVSRGENMDVYLGSNVKELNEAGLNDKLTNTILLLPTEDIDKSTSLKSLLEGKEKAVEGKYSIVVFK